jgi:hypothetical protein
VCRDPDSLFTDLAQERIELRSVETFLDRVHPDEHAVQPEQLFSYRLHLVVGKYDRLRLDAEGSEGIEHRMKAAARRDGTSSFDGVPFSPPEQTNARRVAPDSH